MGEAIINWLGSTGWRILLILAISAALYFAIAHLVPMLIKRTIARQMAGKPIGEIGKRSTTLSRIVRGISVALIIIMALFTILQQLGINVTAAIAGLGIVGIAVGFGAQWLVRDLIAGFFVLFENQYNVGDVIKVGDIMGGVEEISLRTTILRDLDGARHTIPNGEIKVVSNFTQEWSRANITIGVAYKEDLDRVMALMRKTWEEIADDPDWAPFVKVKTPWLLRVDSFGDSGINIKMVGETSPVKQWDVMGEFRRRIKRVFDEEDVEIPWPHIKLYLGDEPVKKGLSKK